jgi:hypothetical protein
MWKLPLGYTMTISYKLKSFLVIIDLKLKLNMFKNMMWFLHIIPIFKFNIWSLSIPHYLYWYQYQYIISWLYLYHNIENFNIQIQ